MVRKKLIDQLVERVFNDAFRAEGLELRNDIPDDGFVNDRFHGQPAFFRQVGDGGAAQGRQGFHETIEGSGGEVHFQTHFPAGFQSAPEHHDQAFQLLLFPFVLHRFPVRDELGIGGHQGVHDAELVGLDGAARFRDVHNGVHQLRHFHFRSAPGEFHMGLDALFLKPAVP